nr:1-acyl-sn-glycerol-3-phosphate acyltransferase [Candidatus Cloacimonadota bacterium]
MKSILWKIWFFIFMLLFLLLYFLLIFCKLFLPRKVYRRLVWFSARYWGRRIVLSTGSEVQISGQELLPEHNRICFVANHQGMFDIPLVLGFVDKPMGFIAKKELFKIPVLSWWMKEIPCVFIDRGSARKAMESFIKSAEVIKAGYPMVIFPEGTRSKGDEVGNFHVGSFKLPMMAEATIVPIAIKNSWKVYEIDHGIHKVNLKMRILKPISPDEPIYHDKYALATKIRDEIALALRDM